MINKGVRGRPSEAAYEVAYWVRVLLTPFPTVWHPQDRPATAPSPYSPHGSSATDADVFHSPINEYVPRSSFLKRSFRRLIDPKMAVVKADFPATLMSLAFNTRAISAVRMGRPASRRTVSTASASPAGPTTVPGVEISPPAVAVMSKLLLLSNGRGRPLRPAASFRSSRRSARSCS